MQFSKYKGSVLHCVINESGSRHSFYQKKRLIFWEETDDERIIEKMKELKIYATFMQNVKQKQAQGKPEQTFSVLQINTGAVADIFCYFGSFDHTTDNGFMHYHFSNRFNDVLFVQDLWAFFHANHYLNEAEERYIPRHLNDNRIN